MAGYSTSTANRTTNDGTWTYTYDAEGNLTGKSNSTTTWNYTYDLRNQLTQAQKHATSGGTLQQQVDYKYDVYGNLVDRNVTVSGAVHTKTAYEIVDPGPGITGSVNVAWADLDSGGSLTTRYLPGGGQGEKLARSTTTGARWLLTDRLGSVREVTDGSGSIIDAINYNGFGGVGSESSPSDTGDYSFTGLRRDTVTGSLLAHWRMFDPTVGQWFEEDPRVFAGDGSNLRRVASNSPTTFTDRTGLKKYKSPAAPTGAQRKENRLEFEKEINGAELPDVDMLKVFTDSLKDEKIRGDERGTYSVAKLFDNVIAKQKEGTIDCWRLNEGCIGLVSMYLIEETQFIQKWRDAIRSALDEGVTKESERLSNAVGEESMQQQFVKQFLYLLRSEITLTNNSTSIFMTVADAMKARKPSGKVFVKQVDQWQGGISPTSKDGKYIRDKDFDSITGRMGGEKRLFNYIVYLPDTKVWVGMDVSRQGANEGTGQMKKEAQNVFVYKDPPSYNENVAIPVD
jgi:RHS repeat-associated protein